MKITPLEIRQKTFEKAFRGLDKDEVQAFLNTLSQEWEKIIQESKELKIKLEASEKEVQKLREVESSLFKTLKTAEDTGANLIDQATKTAELHMKETQMKAEAMMNDARNKARELMEEAEDYARVTLEKMEGELHELAKGYRELVGQKENLLDDLHRLLNDSTERLKKTSEKMQSFDVSNYLKKTKVDSFLAQVNKGEKPKPSAGNSPDHATASPENSRKPEETDALESKIDSPEEDSQSFFDKI